MVHSQKLRITTSHQETMPVGVVLRRAPGVTRWAAWSWTVSDVLPGAGQADWALLRTVDGVSYIHASTLSLDLHASDTESYVHELQTRQPSLYVILRRDDFSKERPLRVISVTASPYEAQDYADNGEDIVERIPMPARVLDWVETYVARHHVETPFKKRRRDKHRTDGAQDGIGDARIPQPSDVYRAPTQHGKAS